MALVCGTCATVIAVAGAPGTAPAAAPTSTSSPTSTYSFITAPTDELGVPGYRAGSELTPTGAIYTGYGEVDWRAGAALAPLPVLGQTLLDGRSPIESLALTRGRIHYAMTVLAAPEGGEPVDFVRVLMTNPSDRPMTAAWGSELSYVGGAHPFQNTYVFHFTPLVAPDPAWSYLRRGREMIRSGQVLEIVPGGASGSGKSAFWRRRLAPGAHWELDFAVPVVPMIPDSAGVAAVRSVRFAAVLADQERYWHRLFGQAMQISVPESKVSDTFDASLALMAESRYPAPGGGWIQTPNKLQYSGFYIRDASFIARALDVAGLHTLAGQDLDYFPSVQGADGLYDSQPGQLDGIGEALWAIGQHAQWPGEAAWARRLLPSVTAGVAWLASAAAADPDGVVPVSTVDDNELASGHITGDDFLAADGLQAAVAMARIAGAPARAAAWQIQLDVFEYHLQAALSAAEKRTGGWIPPDLEDNGGLTWGNLWASYPSTVTLSPHAPAVTATLAHVIPSFRQGIATYAGMLHDYLGFRVFETELERGESTQVVNGLYAELAHTTATDGGFETNLYPGRSRAPLVNLAPHGWFAAEYVTLLRNMLVQENGPSAVQIMAAVSPDWIQPGDTIAVSNAPTTFGTVAYTLHSVAGGARLTWNVHLLPGVALRWRLPAATGSRRVLTLSGSRGSLTVRWKLRGPVPSFATTAAEILATAHG